MSRIRISDSRAPTFFSSMAREHPRPQLDDEADHERRRPGRRRGCRGRRAVMAANISSRQGEAHVPAHLLLEAEQDAAEAGQGAADDPAREDHPVGVDAGRRGQVGVVGHGADGLADAAACRNRATPTSTRTTHRRRSRGPAGAMAIGPILDRHLHGVLAGRRGRTAEREQEDTAERRRPTPIEHDHHATQRHAPRRNGRQTGRRRTVAGQRRRRQDRTGSRPGGADPESGSSTRRRGAERRRCSPWEKLDRPVVPKISDRPDRADGDDQAEGMPSTVSCGNWSIWRLDSARELTAPASWRTMRTRLGLLGSTWRSASLSAGSDQLDRRGRVEGSMVAAYSPGHWHLSTNDRSALLVGLDLVDPRRRRRR